MTTILGAGAVLTAAAGLCWLMMIMERRREWRGRMIKQIEARGGPRGRTWDF